MTITPDDKDWTWVLLRPCGECGFSPNDYARDGFSAAVRQEAASWPDALARPDARLRPRAEKWSVLEYGCHVRDAQGIFHGRLASMLATDNPVFPNWDQDATALEARYDEQDPVVVARELVERAEELASLIDSISPASWTRAGTRSNGSCFTVESITRYLLHDSRHHRWDINEAE